jgi:hypothetical protein
MEDDDEDDRALQMRRDGGSSEARPRANVPTLTRADLRQKIQVANAVAFADNESRHTKFSWPPSAQTHPPASVWHCGKVEYVLGSILDIIQDDCEAVPDWDLIVDCMGGIHRRPWDEDKFRGTAVLECPWNHVPRREANLIRLVTWIRDNLLENDDIRVVRIYVMCRKGERRSAAVMAVILMALHDFSLNAVDALIRDRHPKAMLTTEPEGDHEASYPVVRTIAPIVIAAITDR